jgi:DNA repair protein RecO (recombination protein O)
MALYRDLAVVLRTWKLGEADRIVSLFGYEHGKLRGVAKGVRKPNSRFGARLEAGCLVAVQLYKGRGDLDTITQVELRERQTELRFDIDRFARASAMLEAVDASTPDREPNPPLYEMLVRALRTLGTSTSPLVSPAFLLKVLALEGFEPVVTQCVSCGEADALVAFSLPEGGVQCSSCRSGPSLSPRALELLQQVLGGRLGEALNEPASSATAEVDTLATRLFEHHAERRLRSMGILDRR